VLARKLLRQCTAQRQPAFLEPRRVQRVVRGTVPQVILPRHSAGPRDQSEANPQTFPMAKASLCGSELAFSF
jgi:hypothetical protein